jgi:DNA-binding response OmpR family regulator
MAPSNKILVVEDDAEVRAGTVRVLVQAGYQVVEAENGVRGLEAALASRPDLILSDVAMPEMNGIELCRKVRSTPGLKRSLFVFVSSSRTTPDEQADGLDAGADGYIARPVTNRELCARVASMMRLKAAEDERDQLINQLQEALALVKQLSGILPICMHCKKIRTDEGTWQRIEVYVRDHSEAIFSHGLCPECEAKHFP